MFCPECGFEQPERHRYCVVCGERLPHDLGDLHGKATQLFLGNQTQNGDASDSLLRVSRYPDAALAQPDGTARLVRRHTRISIWEVDRPVCAISLSEDETERLAVFLEERRVAREADVREARDSGA